MHILKKILAKCQSKDLAEKKIVVSMIYLYTLTTHSFIYLAIQCKPFIDYLVSAPFVVSRNK